MPPATFIPAWMNRMTESRSHFDAIASDYDRSLPEHVQAHYRRKRVKLIGPLLAGGKGLDVGCGTGTLMEALREFGTVVGVDGSVGMLQVLRQAGRGEAGEGMTWQLPFADNSFDVAYCIAVLHHVADPVLVRRTVCEMARVTRPGGKLVIWDHNPLNPYWPILMARCPQDTGDERLIPQKEILRALQDSGMGEVACRQTGFVPDFVPACLMPLARSLEWLVERTPMLRRLCAHNVIVATKL
jgi:ubiquinone/menaquinone biosynthesis C-methylase UbiE